MNQLVNPSFQEVIRRFVLSFENRNHRSHSNYYLPKVEIKYHVMIDGKNFFDQPINDFKTYEDIRKIASCQGDDYTTGCLLDYPYFKENFAIDYNSRFK